MRQSVALCLVAALLGVTGLSATLHTHAYSEHEHPEHDHGLAAHGHDGSNPEASGHEHHDGLTLKPCDSGLHKTSIRFVSAVSVRLQVVFASIKQPLILVVVGRPEPPLPHADVRVHGPPARTRLPPRAPPVIALRSIT